MARKHPSAQARPEKFGVWDNDYDTFLWERCKAISRELRKRVIPQEIDHQGQEVHTYDFEAVELEDVLA